MKDAEQNAKKELVVVAFLLPVLKEHLVVLVVLPLLEVPVLVVWVLNPILLLPSLVDSLAVKAVVVEQQVPLFILPCQRTSR